MPGGGSDTQTTTQEPWGPSVPYLETALRMGDNIRADQAFAPPSYRAATGRSEYAGMGGVTNQGVTDLNRAATFAQNNGPVPDAMRRSQDFMGGGGAGGEQINQATQGLMGLGGASAMNGPAATTLDELRTGQGVGSGLRRQGAGMITGGGQGSSLDGVGGYLGDVMAGGAGREAMERARDNALEAAVPAAVAQFAGAGMANSTQAMDTVGRAATQATAPFEYDFETRDQARQMQAAGLQQGAQAADLARMTSAGGALGNLGIASGAQALNATGMGIDGRNADMARRASALSGAVAGGDTRANNALAAMSASPALQNASFAPAIERIRAGGIQDEDAQMRRTADVQNYGQQQGRRAQNFNNYLASMMQLGGLGRTDTATAPGVSGAEQFGSAALGGLGTYGSLAMNPVTAPYAAVGGIGAGILGLY